MDRMPEVTNPFLTRPSVPPLFPAQNEQEGHIALQSPKRPASRPHPERQHPRLLPHPARFLFRHSESREQSYTPLRRHISEFQETFWEVVYRLADVDSVHGRLDFLAVLHGDAVKDADAGVVLATGVMSEKFVGMRGGEAGRGGMGSELFGWLVYLLNTV